MNAFVSPAPPLPDQAFTASIRFFCAVLGLDALVDAVPVEHPVCVVHSAVLPYLGEDECRAFVAKLHGIGKRRELHWVSLEGGPLQTFGARLPFSERYQPRPEDRPTDIFGLLGHAHWADGRHTERLLARVDMHGRWIEWLAGE